MKTKVNIELYNKCKTYIMEDKHTYTFEKFLEHRNLLDGAKYQLDSIMIKCPFHEDESPSMGVDTKRKIYNCFSVCGNKGTYINFVATYMRIIEGHNIGMYRLVDNMLREDKIMQAIIGAGTIYMKEDSIDVSNFKLKRPTINTSGARPNSFIEYAKIIKSKKPSEKEIIDFVSKIQLGMAVSEIYNSYSYNTRTVEVEDDELIVSSEELSMFNLTDI